MTLRRPRRGAVTASLLVVLAASAAAAPAYPPVGAEINQPIPISTAAPFIIPSTAAAAAIVSSRAVIGEISYHGANVFDLSVPGEDWWLFRLADKIHVQTKRSIVAREMLLRPGDRWNPLSALESERNMRSLNIFRRAEVVPKPRPDGTLDLDVQTQDSWTTILDVGAGTEGGDNYLTYGAEEDNLFGYGKTIRAFHNQTGPRRRTEVDYVDPRFLGSRTSLAPFYARTDHGDSISASLVMPFLTLDTPYAEQLAWTRTIDEDIIYRDAQQYTTFIQQSRVVTAGFGSHVNEDGDFVRRLELGWYSQNDEFFSMDSTLPGTMPANRELSGPAGGLSWVVPRYVKETYINRMERVEDFNMGNELTTYAGFMGQATGSDRDRWIFNALDQQGLYLMPGRFALAQVGASGRVANNRWENSFFFTNLNLFWKEELPFLQTWVAHLEANTGRNLDLENQIYLGGNTGLRGYKNYSFAGSKSTLVNLEDRVFIPGEYFHLVRFGAAVFFDTGAVVPEGTGISPRKFRSDVGAGLRLASTRSQTGDVVRLDLAYAVNNGAPGSRWVVSLRGKQAFAIFNSSTRLARQSPSTRLLPPTTQ